MNGVDFVEKLVRKGAARDNQGRDFKMVCDDGKWTVEIVDRGMRTERGPFDHRFSAIFCAIVNSDVSDQHSGLWRLNNLAKQWEDEETKEKGGEYEAHEAKL